VDDLLVRVRLAIFDHEALGFQAASLSPCETILDGVVLGIQLGRPLDFRPAPHDLIGGQAHDDRIEAAERAVLKRALARSGGNVSKAAKDLDVSRATLHRKMNQLGLRR
jgi:transcriptional regulator of acetoin/glycerol metabolism